jgi:hypothetical protein
MRLNPKEELKLREATAVLERKSHERIVAELTKEIEELREKLETERRLHRRTLDREGELRDRLARLEVESAKELLDRYEQMILDATA